MHLGSRDRSPQFGMGELHIVTKLFISLIFCDNFLSVSINYDLVDHFSRSR